MRHLGPLWLVLLEVSIPHRDFTVLEVMLPQKQACCEEQEATSALASWDTAGQAPPLSHQFLASPAYLFPLQPQPKDSPGLNRVTKGPGPRAAEEAPTTQDPLGPPAPYGPSGGHTPRPAASPAPWRAPDPAQTASLRPPAWPGLHSGSQGG